MTPSQIRKCIAEGVREEIPGVGYHYHLAECSIITAYHHNIVFFSYNNEEVTAHICPCEKDAFSHVIGTRGNSLENIKKISGAVDVRMLELSLIPDFSNITSISYKNIQKNGQVILKRQVRVSHLSGEHWNNDEKIENQATAFILTLGEGGENGHSSLMHAQELFSHSMLLWKDMKDKMREERKNEMERQAVADAFALAETIASRDGMYAIVPPKRRSFSVTPFRYVNIECFVEDKVERKLHQQSKGSKFSKNRKVCIANNNSNSGDSKRKLLQLSKIENLANQQKHLKKKKLALRNLSRRYKQQAYSDHCGKKQNTYCIES